MLWTEVVRKTVRNRILCSLSEDDFEALRPYLTLVELKRSVTIQDANARIKHVHFIESGCLSRVARTRSDGLVEVAIVGRFGFVGIGCALGTMTSLHRTMVLVPGLALRIDANDMQNLIEERPTIREHLLRYVQSLIVQKSQTALCNAMHGIDQRLARWLLLAHERHENDNLPVTQDLLAMLLGVRQASVSATLAKFEAEGLVRRLRGSIEIVDRAALEQRACECFGIIQKAHNRLFPATTSEYIIACESHECCQ